MPLKESEKRTLFTLIVIMLITVVISVFFAIWLLYRTAIETTEKDLRIAVDSQVQLIAAVGRFDAEYSTEDHQGGGVGGTLSQVINAHEHYNLPTDSSTFILIEIINRQLSPIIMHDNGGIKVTNRYGLNGKNFELPDWFFLSREDITSNPLSDTFYSDTIIAVYKSFYISDKRFLLIEKIDIEEIRAPYFHIALITLMLVVLFIAIGTRVITIKISTLFRDRDNQIAFSQAILNTAPNPIITTDESGSIYSANRSACLAFSLDPETIIEKSISEIIPSIDDQYSNSHTAIKSDGSEFPIEVSIGTTSINDKTLRVYIITDITARREAERIVYENMAHTAAIIDTVKDGIITIDEEGIVQSMNPAVEKIFGYFNGELENHHIMKLLPKHYYEKNLSTLKQQLASDSKKILGVTHEGVGQHKDGHTFPIELSANEFFIQDKRFYTAVIRDITERKADEKLLDDHRNHLEELVATATTEIKAIVQTAVNAVVTIDQNGIIQLFNPAAEKIFGWHSSEVVGKNVSILMPNIDSHTHDGYIQRYLTTGVTHIIGQGREVEALRKDNSTFPAHIAIGHSKLSDDRDLFVAFIGDITEQKEAQFELIAAKEKAEEAARVKANFLANMSHEIRTPMNAVIGFSELLQQDSGLSEESREHVSTILSSGKSLLGIINDILDFSKIEAGRIDLENLGFHLTNVIKDTLHTLEFKAAEKDLELKLTISDDTPNRIMGDPTRLRQVLINLLGNAIKFTPSGSITLKVQPTEDYKKIQFSVHDTGIGMTPQQLDGVFDAFSQADASTNRRFGGTGLGTTISKYIVELMGGKIWAESEVGVGSTFHFTMTLEEADNQSHCLFEEGSYVHTSYRSPRIFKVLLAEDIPANATLATLRLEQQGHHVTWVKNGRYALEKALAEEYDIILMDVQMPELDGLSATREIRKNAATGIGKLPIIALTASIMREDQQLCFDAGMNAVVGKPIDFPELLSTMESLVTKEQGIVSTLPSVETPKTPQRNIDFTPLDGYVDYESGTKTWGDTLIYTKALMEFSNDHIGSGERIIEILNSKDEAEKQEAQTIAHALKGLAGNLSITLVNESVTQLDASLKQHDSPTALKQADTVNQHLQQACKAISQLNLPAEGEIDGSLEEEGDTIDIIQDLITSLDELNPDAVVPHLNQLSSKVGQEQIKAIQTDVDKFDFDSAKESAQQLLKRFSPENEANT